MAECMLNLWPFQLSLRSCSGPWIWSHRLSLLSCFPGLHTLCCKYLRSQPGKNKNVIREVHPYAKLHQFPTWAILFNSVFSKFLIEMNAFLFMVLSRSKIGMIVTFISFLHVQVSSKPNQSFTERTKILKSFTETRFGASEKVSNNFQLQLSIMKYDLRTINKKCQNNLINQNKILTAKYFKVADDILPLKIAFIDSLQMPMEQALQSQMICHNTNSNN